MKIKIFEKTTLFRNKIWLTLNYIKREIASPFATRVVDTGDAIITRYRYNIIATTDQSIDNR